MRLINKPNGGVSSARNLGIDEAKGKYIVFVDADDYLFSVMLLESINP
ncbi:MAG: glycosyltransferase [Paludibacteraceae bacterium]|nr:glycosyltransferase [Paludibacteraceae bacterium]